MDDYKLLLEDVDVYLKDIECELLDSSSYKKSGAYCFKVDKNNDDSKRFKVGLEAPELDFSPIQLLPSCKNECTIIEVIKRSRHTAFKAHHLYTRVEQILFRGKALILILKDGTGDMQGIVQPKCVNLYNTVVVNAIIILSNVVIYSPIGSAPYALITSDSIAYHENP